VPPLAVIGSLARDRVDGATRVGGGAYHAARALRLLAGRATIVTKGADRELLAPLVALGLPIRFHETETTAAFAISNDGDDRRIEVEAVGDPWTPVDARGWVADAIGRTQWLHVSPLLRSDFPAATLAVLARGRRILFDGQGLVRVARTGPLTVDAAFDAETLRHVTILKLAEDEARIVLRDLGEQSLRRLGVPEILVTLGSRGSIVYADGRVERVPARRVAADATGAGDGFAAAYLAGRASGYAPGAAARRAASVVESMLLRRR
jgi:sugar/nucleoside kinase (ribokinase family)